MITVQIDYRNLLFLIYQDGKLQDNPLTGEVQRVVIEQVIRDCSESICRRLNELSANPDVQRQSAVH